jgi:hypothetical protein
MSHSDGEILRLVIRDLREVLNNSGQMSRQQVELIDLSIAELKNLDKNWGPVLDLYRFGDRYNR